MILYSYFSQSEITSIKPDLFISSSCCISAAIQSLCGEAVALLIPAAAVAATAAAAVELQQLVSDLSQP